MEHKVILSTAWAERLQFTDRDLTELFDIELDQARPCSENRNCPQCGNEPDDSNYQFFKYDPVTAPNEYSGLQYVGCLCGVVYLVTFRNLRFYAPLDAGEEGRLEGDPEPEGQ